MMSAHLRFQRFPVTDVSVVVTLLLAVAAVLALVLYGVIAFESEKSPLQFAPTAALSSDHFTLVPH